MKRSKASNKLIGPPRTVLRYLVGWLDQVKSLGAFRNTLICVVVVCLAWFLVFYHKPYVDIVNNLSLGPELVKYRRHIRMPAAQLYHSVVFLALPLLSLPLLKYRATGGSLDRLGIRLGNWRVWMLDVGVAYVVIATLILIFGRDAAFLKMYPLFKPAGNSWQFFICYQLIQLAYMFSWEFLFRGYMLFAAKKEIGPAAAVILQCLPFALLHAGKPELESIGSILAGLYLGMLALRANSMLPCAILHFAAAFTMDLLAVLSRTGKGI